MIEEKTHVIDCPDGRIAVIPGKDNPIEKIRGLTFFRLIEGGYATAPDSMGIRLHFPLPEGPDTAILLTEKRLSDGTFGVLSRKEYYNS